MKTGMILAAALALTTAPALAQAQQNAPAPQTQTQAQQPAVQTVSVIDVSELPAQSQAQVAQIEEQRTDQDLANLRQSIEASPELLQALERQGATPDDVVAASLSQAGDLTIVTRKES
ncbi:MAG: hypothetical protein KUA43_11505 [Hoeflea sp.]|uniref:hypothetical protein n=1 Tax=Hoeflea sp. TaxID=1940281 RepID=UPI001E07968D|nr:hypothetical protein [Hoeflea sp.]MBU4527636.1 hypothetical protein [Alphaproteobacteria bacterium]MBU4546496.1 hypothetical protein [Alphaproteobacteria bacterium]MBU4552986.1 hypothetical protein [Alphaproteobacteria bacterium]MBV1724058.1 hypothetical protein [Hoeflea sp.]MBV1759743.1 hypothetical protein [Hoeflea sp.]